MRIQDLNIDFSNSTHGISRHQKLLLYINMFIAFRRNIELSRSSRCQYVALMKYIQLT